MLSTASGSALRVGLLLLAGLWLAGCAGGLGHKDPPPVIVDPNMFPTDYKAKVLALLRTHLADPTSVREAFISDPTLKPVGTDSRYVVCVRYDAKNTAGRYIGSRDHMAFFLGGNVNQFIDATNDYCGGANYQPFPEAQALTKP